MKKVLSLLLCLCLLGMSAALAESDPNLNEPGVLPICKETVHLTVGICNNPNIIDLDTNTQTLMLEEEGNYELEFITFPANEMLQKLNVMVQTDAESLPDIIFFGRYSTIQNTAIYNWAVNGAIVPITDYVKNSSYYFKQSMEDAGVDLLPLLTMPDGEIYALPYYNRSLGNEYDVKNWVYQPWLDALGLDAPTDAESLYQVLKAFKEQDPNGNGIADEIPMMSYNAQAIKHLFRSLLSMYCDVGNWYDYVAVKDGKIYPAYTTEEWREGLRYIRRLFDEGLISPLSLTQDLAQFKALLAQDTTVVGMNVSNSLTALLPAGDARRAEYAGIGPFAMADGTVLTPYNPTTAIPRFVISKNCKNPEAAFRLADLLCSEKYTVMSRWGEYGVDWVTPGEGAVALYSFLGYEPYLQETGALTWDSPQNKCWVLEGPGVRGYKIAAGMVWDGSELNSEYQIAKVMPEYIGKGPDEYCVGLIYTEEENELIAEPLTTIDSYVAECMALFATGEMDLDADWDTYLGELQNNDLDTVIAVMQAAYDRSR